MRDKNLPAASAYIQNNIEKLLWNQIARVAIIDFSNPG
jgi:hypothetical protein